jgi:CPA2 family monovalent cation:H+ antiporter-2
LGVKAQNLHCNRLTIVQDIVAILMILLSTVAVSQQFSGTELLFCIKTYLFLTVWFYWYLFYPTLLKKAKHLLTDEMLLISLALCLMMVILHLM